MPGSRCEGPVQTHRQGDEQVKNGFRHPYASEHRDAVTGKIQRAIFICQGIGSVFIVTASALFPQEVLVMKSSIRLFKGFLVFGLVLLFPHALKAAVVDVTTAAELQTALTDAQANGEDDTINIAAGTYNTSDNGTAPFSYTSAEDFPLTLVGAGVGNTILDGGGSGGTQVMAINITASDAPLQISGITFQNGDSTVLGGGLGISAFGGDVHVVDCEFLNNTTTTGGGGLHGQLAGTGTVIIDNNIFQGNNGNGGFGPGAIHVNSSGSPVTFTNNQITGNTAHGSDIDSFSPGGAYVQASAGGATFSNNTFEDNTGGAGGFSPGAFYLQGFDGESFVQGNTVINNETVSIEDFSPGGAYIQTFDASATITDNEFRDNSGGTNDFSPGGAYIQTFDASATITDNEFRDNSSLSTNDFSPGGAYVQTFGAPGVFSRNTASGNDTSLCDDSCPGGIYLHMFDADQIVADNTLLNNTTQGVSSSPGGLHLGGNGGDLVFVNNILGGNVSATGPGGADIGLTDFTMNLINNTFSLNEGGGNGGGVSVSPGSDTTIVNLYNNIVFNNSTTATGEDIFIANTSAPAAEINLFNNDFGEFCLEATATCDFATLGSNQGGNIQEDPLFVDAALGDFRLGADSPAIDAGDAAAPNLPATDHDGNPRPFGPAPDMGALEAVPTLATNPSALNFGQIDSNQSDPLELTILNNGGFEANVSNLVLSDGSNYQLDVNGGANPCGGQSFVIPGLGSCTVTVTFTPTSDNTFNATLTIDSDDPNNPQLVVALTGVKVGGGGCALNPESQHPSFAAWLWIAALLAGLACLRLMTNILRRSKP
jgi:hypothetical protein